MSPRTRRRPRLSSGWASPRSVGLQDAPQPSLVRAWASRPSPDLSPAQEKLALQQQGSRYSAEALLKNLPAPGKVELYREVRCVFIEGIYIFKHIVCTVADKDGHTLGSLQTCALTQARERTRPTPNVGRRSRRR